MLTSSADAKANWLPVRERSFCELHEELQLLNSPSLCIQGSDGGCSS
jgi:hypothetical protein